MQIIYTKSSFPVAPGGDIYEWKTAETKFEATKDGKYVIAVTASAKNAAQNHSTDDDDLRLALDGYQFGKKENHAAMTSWQGFGTAAAWDGASLQGRSKTVYFFVSLTAGEHALTFTADGKPKLEKIEVFQLDQDGDAIEDAIFNFREKASTTPTNHDGVPWKSFVFQSSWNTDPFRVKLIEITATCQSGKQKGGTDGDNIKVYANGLIVANPRAPTSDKYKNFFFSGDQSQGVTETLMLSGEQFLFADRDFSVDLWSDEVPTLERVKVEIGAGAEYDSDPIMDEWLDLNKKYSPLTLITTKNSAEDIAKFHAERHGMFHFDNEGKKKYEMEDNSADACRHFVWNVLLTREYSANDAENITTHHELFWVKIENKQEFSRASIMDLWNNKQGREYAEKYPEKEPLDLFGLALSDGKIVSNLGEVTDEIRTTISNDLRGGKW